MLLKDGECVSKDCMVFSTDADICFVLGVLNSTLAEMFYWTQEKIITLSLTDEQILAFPIVKGTERQIKTISDAVNKIVTSKDMDGSSLEKIDETVYAIYGLSDADIRLTEKIADSSLQRFKQLISSVNNAK